MTFELNLHASSLAKIPERALEYAASIISGFEKPTIMATLVNWHLMVFRSGTCGWRS